MQKTQRSTDTFLTALKRYKSLIDADISQVSESLLVEAHEQFGVYPTEAVKAYVSLLSRGGKRVRGALTMTAYHMLGGKNEEVALKAARAIEMLHAYILMVDDIQDRSEIRRGGPTAHILLKKYHEQKHLKDGAQHFGESIAMNGFLFGVHKALDEVCDLPIDSAQKIAAIKNINRHFVATAHGQSLDIFNEVLETADEEAVDKVLLWKTAYYTFMNPLQFGAILAGANEDELAVLETYSLQAGRVFQITDDILGIFGEEDQAGKSPLDDMKEGKRTILTVKALELAPKADAYFLESMLGNKDLTRTEFMRCRNIISECGALNYAKRSAQDSAVDAVAAVDAMPESWRSEDKQFLKDLVTHLIDRKS